MNPTLVRAVIVVTLALVCYSVGVVTEQRKHSVTKAEYQMNPCTVIGILLEPTIMSVVGRVKDHSHRQKDKGCFGGNADRHRSSLAVLEAARHG